MQKKKTIALAVVSCALNVSAQEAVTHPSVLQQDERIACSPAAARTMQADTLTLPSFTHLGTISHHSYYSPFGGWNDWSLHPGLNASLSLSATVGIGSNSRSGFAQSLALMYATEIAPRLSLAAGGYYSHFNWGPATFNDAGLSAVIGYRFNERWEAYLFGQKSLMTPKMPMPLYYASDIGDKIGAELRYNVSPSFSVGLRVWRQSVSDARPAKLNPRPSGADYSAPR